MKKAFLALGRLKKGTLNKTELAYQLVLEAEKQSGKILWYKFEGIKLMLADRTSYTPDFFVLMADGSLEAREVKGFWQDDARVKIKIAAEMYPFKFIAIKKCHGSWQHEEF